MNELTEKTFFDLGNYIFILGEYIYTKFKQLYDRVKLHH